MTTGTVTIAMMASSSSTPSPDSGSMWPGCSRAGESTQSQLLTTKQDFVSRTASDLARSPGLDIAHWNKI